MSIFKKRKVTTPSTTTVAAPVQQEKPDACKTTTSDRSVFVNVFKGYDDGGWVFPNKSPKYPTPREETITLGQMPLKNCAVPAGWFFPEYGDDEMIVYRFPTESANLLAIAYAEGAVYGTQYITFEYKRDLGCIFATAWGYHRDRPGTWQVAVLMDVVQTFREYLAIMPNGTPAMDTRLCNSNVLSNLIYGNPLFTRVAYNMSYDEAVDAYEVLLSYVKSFICTAAQGMFKNDLQIKADRFYETIKSYEEKFKALVSQSEAIIAHVATKEFYGFDSSESDWDQTQQLYDNFVTMTAEIDQTGFGNIYYQLRYAEKACGLKLDLSKYEEIVNLVTKSYEKLRGTFDLLRS